MLERINFKLDESRARQIFARADTNNTNDLTQDQFCVAMRLLEIELATQCVLLLLPPPPPPLLQCALQNDCLIPTLAHTRRSALENLGLSMTAIVAYVLIMALSLALLFVFVLLGIGALTTNTSFGAVINTLLPMSAGGALFASGSDGTSDVADAIASPETSRFGRAVAAALDFILKSPQHEGCADDDEEEAAGS